MTAAILAPDALGQLRRSLAEFTVDGIAELLGPAGRAAYARADLAGMTRALPADERLATLIRLFVLGTAVDEPTARSALHPLRLEDAGALVERGAGRVRARVQVRAQDSTDQTDPWWVVSDFGNEVRPGPLAHDHVLGPGGASTTLANATPRRPVGRALDLGTGCGVQALRLAAHASLVVATDISTRALRLAATTAALSGQSWQLRQGSLLEPVQEDSFDLIVANPPFVVSPGLRPGSGGYDYRDSGLTGDRVSEVLLRGLPNLLTPDGSASLLANWIVPPDGDWGGRVAGWLAGADCDAWVWQREVVEPAAYVALWLRDAGEQPGTPRWIERYDAWLDWFDTSEVRAVGMGLVTLWKNAGGVATIVCEDVPQAVEQPAGQHLAGWVERQRWLASHDDAAVLGAFLRCADGIVRTRHDLAGKDGWTTVSAELQQLHGMRWSVEVDDSIAALVAACDGSVPLHLPVSMLAAVAGRSDDEVADAVLPVVRDLVGRGFLEPSTP